MTEPGREMAGLEEGIVTRVIVSKAADLLAWLTHGVDVAIVGAGPSGLTAAYYLAKRGAHVVVFERRLSFGGGIGGGGMLLPALVIEHPADAIAREIGLRLEEAADGLYAANPAELIARLATAAIDAGARILLGVTVEDLIYRVVDDKLTVCGVVINWTAVHEAGLHVDPLAIPARAVVDATGHEASVLRKAAEKLPNAGLQLLGERGMWVTQGEQLVVDRTGMVLEGLYATGMTVAALCGLPRMGPIFGGMLLSGERVAELIAQDLGLT